MTTLHILGSSALGGFGSNVDALFDSALAPAGRLSSPTSCTDALSTYLPSRALRRIDHFSRMALLGAFSALADAKLTPNSNDMDGMGIVLATGYGPAQLTFNFLDGIIDHGSEMASPLAFSHSVHNIPAATIAQHCGITGPTCTVCQFETSVASALLTARSWICEKRCDRILFGAVDERTEFMDGCRPILGGAADGSFSAEGAAFFVLSASQGTNGCITNVELTANTAKIFESANPILLSGHTQKIIPNQRAKQPNMKSMTYAYGHFPVTQAFDIIIGLRALKEGTSLFSTSFRTMQCLCADASGLTSIIDICLGDE